MIGLSHSVKPINGLKTYSLQKGELQIFLQQSNIIVCLLPLTPETNGILNLQLFEQLPKGAYLINVGRGQHLIEEDLAKAIELGYLKGACLDVYQQEPLPKDHPFWRYPEIIMTPHIASITDQERVGEQIVENYCRLEEGLPLLHEVNRGKGY